MADGRSPRSIQDCPRVSLLWKPVPLESTIFLGSPDYISERDLIRCPSELRCLTRVKACPSVEKLGLAGGRLPRSIVLDPFYLYCSSSSQVPVKFQFPDPRRVRSHRSDSPVPVPVKVQFLSRSSSSQVPVPGSKTSPIPSIRLSNISSSSRIQDESDPIDPTQQYKFQFPFQLQFPGSKSVPDSAIRVRSHRSDSSSTFQFTVPDYLLDRD